MARVMHCPFLIRDNQDKRGICNLSCERGKLRFNDRRSFDEYVDSHCGSQHGWQRCSMAINLLNYYNREDVR